MKSESVRLSARRALIWSLAERYASFMVTVASTLVLARLLTPAQVGVYSVCAAMGTTAAILRDFGVSEYLIQEKDLTRDKIRAAFGVALLVAWALGASIFFSRNAVAGFFGEPGVAQVLAVTSLHFLILPISSPAFALLNREMAFHKIFALQITCNAAQAVTAITLAYRGHGYMSLAWGPIVNVAVQTVILTWMRPKESFVMPGLRQARGVLRFGAVYMSARIIETLAQNFHDPVIAKRFDFASVGLFSRAYGVVEMFRTNVADAIVRVASPAFAAGHRDGRPLGEDFSRATAIFVSISWPFFGFVALSSQEIIGVLFGPQWLAAAPLASVLAMAAIPAGLYEFVPQLLSVTGHVKRRLALSLWISPLHIGGVLLASLVSLQVMAAVWIFSSLAMLVLCMMHLRAVFGVGARMLARACSASAWLAATSVAAQACTLLVCHAYGSPALLSLLCVSAAGMLAWLVAGRALKHPAYGELSKGMSSLRARTWGRS